MSIANGTVFGYWTAGSVNNISGYKIFILCRCKCGVEKFVRASKLTDGTSKSCGCLRAELRTTHGATSTEKRKTSHEYWVWNAMVQRCTNPNDAGYKNYGGRGITVCKKWRTYEGFIEDMGNRPSDKHSIDRLNNDSGYSKDNCAWVDRTRQARNKRNNRFIFILGESKTLQEWSEIYKIGHSTILARIRSGWNEHDAVVVPLHKKPSR